MKVLEPDITVPDIVIEMDDNAEYESKEMMNEWGRNIPIIMFDPDNSKHVLPLGDCLECHINVGLQNLPTFNMYIDDDSYMIREALKRNIDKCVIFFGYQTFYVKFVGLITEVKSGFYDSEISISGIWYQEPLYNNKQQIWNETSIIDILKEVHTETKLGINIFDNNDLNFVPDVCINPSLNALDFTKQLLKRYTNNIWCYDTFGYLHIGDIDTMMKQPIDKYTISPQNFQQYEPADFIFTNASKYHSADDFTGDPAKTRKIFTSDCTVSTNFSLSQLFTGTKYTVFDDESNEQELVTNEEIGYGTVTDNTWSGFIKHKFPYYKQRVNKLLYGNLIKLHLQQVMYEIIPFSIVNLELYVRYTAQSDKGEVDHLDEEHSGKHIVIAYSYDYEKNNNDTQNHIYQTLYLI